MGSKPRTGGGLPTLRGRRVIACRALLSYLACFVLGAVFKVELWPIVHSRILLIDPAVVSAPSCGIVLSSSNASSGLLSSSLRASHQHEPEHEPHEHGREPIRIAIALYGLVRHNCSSANFDRVFLQPLREDPRRRTYVVDVLLHANIAVSDRSVRSREFGESTLDRYAWASYNPCAFSAQDQSAIDALIEPTFRATYGTAHHNDRRRSRSSSVLNKIMSCTAPPPPHHRREVRRRVADA